MSIGLKINRLIGEKNVRKTELSKYLGVARNTLDDYLLEKTYMTSEKIEKVAKFFNVSISFLFDELKEPGDNAELVRELEQENDRLKNIISENNIKSSHIFLAVPIDDAEFPDLNEVRDRVLKILSKK